MSISFPFDRNYEIELLEELPGTSDGHNIHYFPGATEGGGKDGFLLRITASSGEPWIGVFEFGHPAGRGFAILSCPDPNMICVIAARRGYIVNASDPQMWSEVPSFSIYDAIAVKDKNLLLFVDNTTIAAWGPNGLLWKTRRLSWDGLTIDEIGDDFVTGTAWDPTNQSPPPFRVQLSDGFATGGVRFD